METIENELVAGEHREDILLKEGEFVFTTIDEDGRSLQFDPPLKITWSCYRETKPMEDGEWSMKRTIVFVDYDFGMPDKFCPYDSIRNGWGYNGISLETPMEEIVKSFIKFDLFHAFCHYPLDPNYSHLHWALFGNLKEQTKVIDNDENV